MKLVVLNAVHSEPYSGRSYSAKGFCAGIIAVGLSLAVSLLFPRSIVEAGTSVRAGQAQWDLKCTITFDIVSINETLDKDSPPYGLGHLDVYRASDGAQVLVVATSRKSAAEIADYVASTLRRKTQIIERSSEVASGNPVGERILAVSTGTQETGRQYLLIVTHGKTFSQISSASLLDVLALDHTLGDNQTNER